MKPKKSRGARGRSVLIVLVTVQLSFARIIGWAQSDETAPSTRLRYQTDAPLQENYYSNAPQKEGGPSGLPEVPYSQLFRDTDHIDLFKQTHIDNMFEPRAGSGGAKIQGGVLSGRLEFPFTANKAFRPDQAEIKIANFYIDIRALTASVLQSDNVDFSEFHRRSGTLAQIRLDFAIFAPLTQNLQISAAGAILYLPTDNRAGFALFDPFRQFEYQPIFRTQIAYDLNISNWQVELLNDFRIQGVPYDLSLSYSYFNGAFEEGQREGHYSYGGGASPVRTFDDRSPYGQFEAGLIQAENRVGGRATTVLPSETAVDIGAFHTEYWYLSGADQVRLLPHNSDYAYITLRSVRDNMRFKPFVTYWVMKYDYYTDWEEGIKGGIAGPVTENIFFIGSVGERWLSLGHSETIWDMRLRHQIGPYTSHSIEYSQDVTDPDRDLRQEWIYRFTQIIGDGLVGDLYGSWANFDDLDNTGTGSDVWRAGVRLTYQPSVKTSLQAAGTYTKYSYDLSGPDSDTWRAYLLATHRFTPTFEGRIQYQYTDRNSSLRGDSYYEHLFIASVIKYF